jgi:hypothetical protein
MYPGWHRRWIGTRWGIHYIYPWHIDHQMLGNWQLDFHTIWSIRCIHRPCTIIHQSKFEVRQIGILPVHCMTHRLMNYKVRDVNSMSKSTVVICPHKEERLPEMEHIPLYQMPSSQSILATHAYRVESTPMGGESNASKKVINRSRSSLKSWVHIICAHCG